MVKEIKSYSLSPEAIAKIDNLATGLGMSHSEVVDFVFAKTKLPEQVKSKISQIKKLQGEIKLEIGKT